MVAICKLDGKHLYAQNADMNAKPSHTETRLFPENTSGLDPFRTHASCETTCKFCIDFPEHHQQKWVLRTIVALSLSNSGAGRQRLKLDLFALQHGQDLASVHQVITADAQPTYIPPEAGQGIAYWPLYVWRQNDAFGLAVTAATLFNSLAPQVRLQAVAIWYMTTLSPYIHVH